MSTIPFNDSPVRLYPCIHAWTPEVKCREYVFLNRSSCVDCRQFQRKTGDIEETAAELHENFVRYLLDKYPESDGITYEEVNRHIARSKKLWVDDPLSKALDYIQRNFPTIYHNVCDSLERAWSKGPHRWSAGELAGRLEQLQREQQERERLEKSEA
ncbi:hypothetical protein B0T10DRAFT_292521 [Thelonectria olida]|uniref:Uncharacterized protein n=1 Tax=Thelonectria olida TaxID=1576542 RepID=A0A9P9AS37_9HYPO|nr:hypothetical protein B0T10DRAFT_292521 [Thelonectria olida]